MKIATLILSLFVALALVGSADGGWSENPLSMPAATRAKSFLTATLTA
jgi:hypothetical protein